MVKIIKFMSVCICVIFYFLYCRLVLAIMPSSGLMDYQHLYHMILYIKANFDGSHNTFISHCLFLILNWCTKVFPVKKKIELNYKIFLDELNKFTADIFHY